MRAEEEAVWTGRFWGEAQDVRRVMSAKELETKDSVVYVYNPRIWGAEAGRSGVKFIFSSKKGFKANLSYMKFRYQMSLGPIDCAICPGNDLVWID